MAIKSTQKGFALYIAVVFMSVMLTLGLALGSLGYKQQIIASDAVRSQYAFYAADAALECVLYADQKQNNFDYGSHSPVTHPELIDCGGVSATELLYFYNAQNLQVKERVEIAGGAYCADVMVVKDSTGTTRMFSQGYDISCGQVGAGGRFASRGLWASY